MIQYTVKQIEGRWWVMLGANRCLEFPSEELAKASAIRSNALANDTNEEGDSPMDQRVIIVDGFGAEVEELLIGSAKWLERIGNRKAEIPPALLDNSDPEALARKIRKCLAECRQRKSDSGELQHRIHIIPIDDVQLHSGQAICWCHPLSTDGGKYWIHNAGDCREAFERRDGIKCSEGWVLMAEFRGNCQMEIN
jgi:hypothetical protein